MTSHPPYGRARWATAGPAPTLLRTAEGASVRSPEATWSRTPGEAKFPSRGQTLAPFTHGGATPSEAVGQVSRNWLGLLFALC